MRTHLLPLFLGNCEIWGKSKMMDAGICCGWLNIFTQAGQNFESWWATTEWEKSFEWGAINFTEHQAERWKSNRGCWGDKITTGRSCQRGADINRNTVYMLFNQYLNIQEALRAAHVPVVVEESTQVNPEPEQIAESTQCDVLEVQTQETMTIDNFAEQEHSNPSAGGEDEGKLLLTLLKVFHVHSKYKSTTGRDLPDIVSFFGMSLLGITSIQGFEKTLQQSRQYALQYVDVSS